MSASSALPSATVAESSRLADFLGQTAAITAVEIRKLTRDPTELATRAIQPALWLLIFGQVFSRIRAIPTGNLSYLEFMAPGVLAQGVLFAAIFYGIGVIWEKDLGIIHKLLASPASRLSLVLGKAIAAAIRSIPQTTIIYILAALLGVRLDLRPDHLLVVLLLVALGSATFATFSLVVACVVKTRERFMGIGQVLTMPLFFASNAIYPIDLMPGWLQVIAHVNPLTYLVDGLRSSMIQGGPSHFGLLPDTAAMLAVFVVLMLVAARLYPGLAR
ncbi:MAG: ABC transporter permease [Gemmatimonadota bacterium]